ncbi:MAG: hypothetical protein RLZZ156_2684 [Deinococcota bacterium]
MAVWGQTALFCEQEARECAGVKRCQSLKDVLRNTKWYYSDWFMEIACGLHNLRVLFANGLYGSRANFYFR